MRKTMDLSMLIAMLNEEEASLQEFLVTVLKRKAEFPKGDKNYYYFGGKQDILESLISQKKKQAQYYKDQL
jgi:hypothetical protein